MFGSEIVAEVVYDILAQVSAVTTAVGSRIFSMSVFPSTDFPALIHYAESGTYEAGISQPINHERLSYCIRFVCDGESTDPIWAAAHAALTALDSVVVQHGVYQVTFIPTGEYPVTTMLESGKFYRQLGFYLQADVFTGG